MIAAVIIIGLAFVWLGFETRGLTIRLETGRSRNFEARRAETRGMKEGTSVTAPRESGTVETELVKEDGLKVKKTGLPDNAVPYKPAEFEPLDMPETSGSLNIICQRG